MLDWAGEVGNTVSKPYSTKTAFDCSDAQWLTHFVDVLRNGLGFRRQPGLVGAHTPAIETMQVFAVTSKRVVGIRSLT